eukprot:CAMPEP_0170180586 /NCGR_PEP_ID=MMETSP0040_2-20121228/22385_1 /TAXON_ID=641309 /ORGANISM="Lotharella oceanica, Strain CCMP622" /LENGTH=223 /DNA_ID=CAMNT_0010425283 /DNA_START=244 /DNA_END=915 /DNA_ORIENTATION=+
MALERLKGLTLADTTLKIARPNDFQLPPPHLVNFVCTGPRQVIPTPAALGNPSAMGLGQISVAEQVAKAKAAAAIRIAEAKRRAAAATVLVLAQAEAKKIGEPSPILVLLNMVKPHDLIEEEEFNEIRNEIGNECSKFGHLVDVIIPRPGEQNFDDEDDDDDDDDDDEKAIPGLGRVFLQYATKEDATNARQTLHGRRFSDNLVEARFYPVDKFEAKDYGWEG